MKQEKQQPYDTNARSLENCLKTSPLEPDKFKSAVRAGGGTPKRANAADEVWRLPFAVLPLT